MIRVAIVDDHPIARRGVQATLTESGTFELVASVDSPAALVDAPDALPDVIVLDLYHDQRPCLPEVTRLSARARVLVMSASGAPKDVLGAVRAGARGYLTKHAQPAEFVAAVELVAGGGFWLSSQLADIMQTLLSAPAEAEVRLSPREEQTLDLIARGFTHAQAATRMGVSKATVDTYVERIRAKLHVGNKAELTRVALRRSPQHPPDQPC
ncbi:response regulator [Micromonospora sp. NPDC000089]|uniref:response regulator n=1 Tax=unclassified Micromonospora TaxID=2617518 RepID=UPI0036D17E40